MINKELNGLRDALVSALEREFEGFRWNHKVIIEKDKKRKGQINIKYTVLREKELHKYYQRTHLDLEVKDEEVHLGDVLLDEELRGRGLGWQLYESTHEFARMIGAKRVTGLPVDYTETGETRKNWVLRRGYKTIRDGMVALAI